MQFRKYLWAGMDRLQFRLVPNDMLNRKLQRLLNSAYLTIYHKGRTPRIKVIGIQTITGCNYSCSFCPANKGDGLYGGVGAYQYRKMAPETFGKIMAELRAMTYKGTISLFMMNEALMDSRIVVLTSMAKTSNPHARIQIDTNGSLLTKELAQSLFNAGLDVLIVNDYTEGHTQIQKIRSWKLGLPRSKCRLVKRRAHEVQDPRGHKIGNRAGNVPGFAVPDEPVRLFCERPFNHLYVGYNGDVVLCCQDWNFEGVLGNVASGDSLTDIWEGDGYAVMREMLLRQDRWLPVCCKCDFVGIEPQ